MCRKLQQVDNGGADTVQLKGGYFHKRLLFVVAICLALVLWLDDRKFRLFYHAEAKSDYLMEGVNQCDEYNTDIPIVVKDGYHHRQRGGPPNIFLRAAVYLNNGLTYVEFSNDMISLAAGGQFDPSGPQYRTVDHMFTYYRVYVSEFDDPLCKPFASLLEDGSRLFEPANLADGQCVAVEGFDDPALLRAVYER